MAQHTTHSTDIREFMSKMKERKTGVPTKEVMAERRGTGGGRGAKTGRVDQCWHRRRRRDVEPARVMEEARKRP